VAALECMVEDKCIVCEGDLISKQTFRQLPDSRQWMTRLDFRGRCSITGTTACFSWACK